MEKIKMRDDVCARAVLELEAYDCPITSDNIIQVVSGWAANLRSGIGEEAHRHLESIGVKDMTGMTWEEQDARALAEAQKYEAFVEYFSVM